MWNKFQTTKLAGNKNRLFRLKTEIYKDLLWSDIYLTIVLLINYV